MVAAGARLVAVGAGEMMGELKGVAVKGVDSGEMGVDKGARVEAGQMVAVRVRVRVSMGSLTRGGVFVPALSQPMTRGFERPMVGATHIEEDMPQRNCTKKAFDPPPEGGPPLRTGRMGSEYPDAAMTPFFHPGCVDHIAHLSRPERQRCSWGACRQSGG